MAEPIGAVGALNAAVGLDDTAAVAPITPAVSKNDTPFQVMLDAAIGGLRSVSATEEKADAYISQYTKGNVAMEEVMMETSKMTMAVQLATTVVNQAVTTFKEIQQMPV